MGRVYDKLKNVPVFGKQDLYSYIAESSPDSTLQITTASGRLHSGRVVSLSKTGDDGPTILLQILDNNGREQERLLHIALRNIESTEFFQADDMLMILSRGKFTGAEKYEPSGALEVKRALKSFADTIQNNCGFSVGTPEINLPANGLVLNRILKLTAIIQQAILDLFSDEDAIAAWKAKYGGIAFLDSDEFKVTGNNNKLELFFPFCNLEIPLMNGGQLKEKLMAVL